MIESAVYISCALLSILSAVMLYRRYRQSPASLLLWSSLAFLAMAINNIILVVDLVVFPSLDMSGPLLRNVFGAVSGSLLLFGLIGELT
jgi:hypothetical protein